MDVIQRKLKDHDEDRSCVHTVTSLMAHGLMPARVCRANSASLNHANLSPTKAKTTSNMNEFYLINKQMKEKERER